MLASTFLRRALVADAAVSGAAGLLMAAGAGFLQGMLNVPAPFLRVAGLILIPYALRLIFLARDNGLAATRVWTVIAINFAWALASVLVLVTGRLRPNALGYAFILVQALAAAAFGELQYVGLRRSTTATA